MRRGPFLLSAATGALASSVVPVTALLALGPHDYGAFSTAYLVFAFGLSLLLSTVTEAWSRRAARGDRAQWQEYWAAVLCEAAVAGIAVAIVSALIADLAGIWWLLGAASAASIARVGARYRHVAEARWSRVIAIDVLLLLAFAAGLAVGWTAWSAAVGIAIGWLAGGLLSLTALRGDLLRLANPLSWWSKHRPHIRTLLADSLLLDAGSIGTPLALAPLLGTASFGVYRAVSNVALPSRLILEPLRASIAAVPPHRIAAAKMVAGILALGLTLGGAAFAILEWGVPALPFRLGTLSELAAFSLAAGVFVAASFVSHLGYISCRTWAEPRALLLGRVVQTGTAIVLPFAGFFANGLSGAITGYVIATCIAAIVWMAMTGAIGRRLTTLGT